MPIHVYTVCSRLSSEDRHSGLISLYHVFEELAASRPAPGQAMQPFVFRVTSCWMRGEADNEQQEFELELNIRLPRIEVHVLIPGGRFHFGTRYRRFIIEVVLQTLIPEDRAAQLEGVTMMFVDSSVRQVGSADWHTNTYPVTLVWTPPPDQHSGNGEAPELPA